MSHLSNAFQTFLSEAPAHAAAWHAAVKGLDDASALDKKTEELAYLAVLAALGRTSGVPFHVASAQAHGASREEIISAVLLGLPAAGSIVTQSLPVAVATYDEAASAAANNADKVGGQE
ncbi:carboxymuconolactone decarboxylase family protein [Uliginosibacterium sp. sgz301328]|uniref:carboxymuconolactone decarboxylase family protein n=1 Tax=Uliginosibacterium sp. sgz301328 TaxID=3243764 RepID=UPI00359EAC28